MVIKLYKKFMSDSLYKNSVLVMASTAVQAVLGFFFWILNARYYSVEDIGIATTLISLSTLISSIGLLGLNIGLMRYLPTSKSKNALINSSFLLVIGATSLVSMIFLVAIQLYSPQLAFLRENMFYIVTFVLFMIVAALNILLEAIFISLRGSLYLLLKNTIWSTIKLALPFVFISLGAYGIFTGVSVAGFIAILFSLIVLVKKFAYIPHITFRSEEMKKIALFAGGNYVSNFFFQAPSLILPLIIINHLGSKVAAYYYINTMILNLLVIIPLATTQVLLSEGSYDEKEMFNLLQRAVRIIALLLVPAIVIFFSFGDIILGFFGKKYATEAFQFLQIISVSALFISISNIGAAVLRLLHAVKLLVVISLMSSVLIIASCYAFLSYGIIGVGWGLLLGQIFSACIFIFFLVKIYFRSKI